MHQAVAHEHASTLPGYQTHLTTCTCLPLNLSLNVLPLPSPHHTSHHQHSDHGDLSYDPVVFQLVLNALDPATARYPNCFDEYPAPA